VACILDIVGFKYISLLYISGVEGHTLYSPDNVIDCPEFVSIPICQHIQSASPSVVVICTQVVSHSCAEMNRLWWNGSQW